MSIKIHHAFKTRRTVTDVAMILRRFRERVRSCAMHELAACVDYVKQPDLNYWSAKLSDAWISQSRSEPMNVESSAIVCVHPKVTGTLVVFCGLEDYRRSKPMKHFPMQGFRPWFYHGGTDSARGVSRAEYMQRKRDWEYVLEGTCVLGEAGLVSDFVDLRTAELLLAKHWRIYHDKE